MTFIDSLGELSRIQAELNRLMEEVLALRRGGVEAQGARFFPAVDVIETAEEVVIRAEVPGVRVAKLRVRFAPGQFLLEGEKDAPRPPAGAGHHVLVERPWGRFSRAVVLRSAVNPRQASAVLAGGVLTVRAPRIQRDRRGEEVVVKVEGAGLEVKRG